MAKKYTAKLVGRRIIVLDPREGGEIYRAGFYGKFYAMPKPRTPDIDRELELSYFDALYLLDKGVLRVVNAEGRELSREELVEIFSKYYENFEEAYRVYKDLRDRDLVVKSGMKYGATFVVYEYGPGIDHAPFLVHALPFEGKLDPLEIIRAGRLSHSVRKKFIIAYVNRETEEIHYFIFKWLM